MRCNGIRMRQLCRFYASRHRIKVAQPNDLLLRCIRTEVHALSLIQIMRQEYTLIAGHVPQEDISEGEQ
jgi:hypothetical protein